MENFIFKQYILWKHLNPYFFKEDKFIYLPYLTLNPSLSVYIYIIVSEAYQCIIKHF